MYGGHHDMIHMLLDEMTHNTNLKVAKQHIRVVDSYKVPLSVFKRVANYPIVECNGIHPFERAPTPDINRLPPTVTCDNLSERTGVDESTLFVTMSHEMSMLIAIQTHRPQPLSILSELIFKLNDPASKVTVEIIKTLIINNHFDSEIKDNQWDCSIIAAGHSLELMQLIRQKFESGPDGQVTYTHLVI
ncbi:hypothetical protein SAMD00019534_113710 [Acytostelium subglobosum LB1]|uniref:hypothetical protein n=1 Tax=Acytostelium subglobosum LB1 TaxID=1410327 RepID=UPI0006450153|nr:hypothetical protein SAMD00019534_113710 [Acytostelium subglobosum LB1]GAM28195.1 hypothetical protein SAMD00019534_113710 [Acytostelium subglobosum LB1]|eukprot:XP_012748829.1 hypothetical protein SAMD00019534_113710 [Acytostelium subglobosum LB1]